MKGMGAWLNGSWSHFCWTLGWISASALPFSCFGGEGELVAQRLSSLSREILIEQWGGEERSEQLTTHDEFLRAVAETIGAGTSQDFYLDLIEAIRFSAEKRRALPLHGEHQKHATPPSSQWIEVAQILWADGSVRDPATLIASVLGDLHRAADVTLEEIEGHFGTRVARLVDQIDWNEEGAFSQENPAFEVQAIRLADCLQRLRHLALSSFSGSALAKEMTPWPYQRAENIIRWGEELLSSTRGEVAPLIEEELRELIDLSAKELAHIRSSMME